MGFESQIAGCTNPQEFTHLCNVIFADKWGEEYHQIDDDQSDEGKDGYLQNKQWLFARHCFKRPSKVSQKAEILKKARTDLKKAKDLRDGGLQIKKWILVTSYKVPGPAHTEIVAEGKKYGFEVGFIGPAYLAKELLGRSKLLPEFPWLHALVIDENLKFIKEAVGKGSSISSKQAMQLLNKASVSDGGQVPIEDLPSDQEHYLRDPQRSTIKKSKDYRQIISLYSQKTDSRKIEKIKTIIYASTDQEAILQGVLALISWYKFSRESVSNHLDLINIGIVAAEGLSALDAEAILLAEEGTILSTQFTLLDLEGWGEIEMTNRGGFPITTPEERDRVVTELKSLNQNFNRLFKRAIEKSLESKRYLAITRVFSLIGSSAGLRAGHFTSLGLHTRAAFERRVCKSSFMYAKGVAARAGNEEEVAYVLHNFANALGFIGETEEALGVLDEALRLAKKNQMKDILSSAGKLTKLIKEPKIRLA